jgi:AcrR family transcriptional regulator
VEVFVHDQLLDPATLPAGQLARRERVLHGAAELLRSAEYDAIEVRDVAKEAGVSLATVYRYFPSKELLFGSVLADWAAGFPTSTKAGRTSAAPTTEAEIRTAMRRAVRAYERFPQMVRVLMMLESSTDPRVRTVYRQFADQSVGAIVDSSAGSDVAADIVDAAYGVMNTKLRAWVFGLTTIGQVDRSVQRCLDLIFAPAPLS